MTDDQKLDRHFDRIYDGIRDIRERVIKIEASLGNHVERNDLHHAPPCQTVVVELKDLEKKMDNRETERNRAALVKLAIVVSIIGILASAIGATAGLIIGR